MTNSTLFFILLSLVSLGGNGYLYYERLEMQKQQQAQDKTLDHQRSLLNSLKNSVDLLNQENSLISHEHKKSLSEIEKLNKENAEKEKKIEEVKNSKTHLQTLSKRLKTILRNEIKRKSIEITESNGQLKLGLKNKILFASGQATVNSEGQEVLKRIAEQLKSLKGHQILIEGHTDNIPVRSGAIFQDNWQLSSARALNVLRQLIEQTQLPPKTFQAVALGEHSPLNKNDSEENRAKNRRIEIRLRKG